MMKHLTVLTTFLMTIGGVVAADEGRYSIAAGKSLLDEENLVFILDTKTGKLRYCYVVDVMPNPKYKDDNLRCGPWVDPE